MRRFLYCLIAFLIIGSAVGGAVLFSNLSYSDNRGGDFNTPQNSITAIAPDNSDLWTDGHYADAFDNEGEAGIDGTSEEKAYEIRTAEQLALLAYRINTYSTNSTYRSLYYVQTANIDLSAHYWDAIGTYTSRSNYSEFVGHYDGGNFTISGLYIESYDSYQGLFGYVRGQAKTNKAIIKNIGIIDSNIQGNEYVGGVVGRADYSTITNCYNTGSVTGDGCVGGVVGQADYSTITNCYNTGDVIENYYYCAGGVVGYACYSTITNCYNTGNVTGSGNYVGGVVGQAYSSTITNSYNTGSATGSEDNVGGVVGRAYYSTIINCYNTGSVTGSGWHVGGVVGHAINSATVTNCYNAGSVDGVTYVGGVVGRADSSTITNNYYGGNSTLSYGIGYPSSNTGASKDENLIANAKSLSWYQDSSKWDDKYSWDFENVWRIDSNINNGYPYLSDLFGDMFPNDISYYWTNEGNYADSFADGSGTESDPYQIATPKQLARLACLINSSSTNSTYKSLYYVQTANLDMSEYWWDAIGTSSYYFSGHYDGGNFTISGLYTEIAYSYQGLFGYVRGQSETNMAIIKNVGITDSNIQGHQFVGGVMGYAYYSTITNSYNTGSATGSEDNVGGVVGYVNNSDITNCYNTGTVSGSGDCVGGVVGCAYYSTITNCYNTGSVTGSGDYVDGVVGYVNNSDITNCYNAGSVTGDGYVGGVVGRADSSTVTNSYNTGTVTESTGKYYIGGVVGVASHSTITNCYNTGSVEGGSDVGGVVGSAYSSTITNCYNTGSVTGSDYVGGVVGRADSSTITNNYYGGNCTLSYGIGVVYNSSGSSNLGASKDNELVANAKSLSWYQDTSNWNRAYPWDFEEVWSFVPSVNDGYPVLEATLQITVTYNNNFTPSETISETKVGSGASFTIASYDLFARTGYEISHWNTSPTGSGVNYYAGDVYAGGASLTLYAQWEPAVYRIELNANDGSGGLSAMYVKYNTGFYSNSTATAGLSSLSDSNLPTRAGYTLLGFYTANSTSSTCLISVTTNSSGVRTGTFTDAFTTTYFTGPATLYAQWKANNPAYYDEAGGYWYIENGRMPQTRVTDAATISALNANWSTLENGSTYVMGPTGDMVAKIYGGKEYCTYNGEYYRVEPIKWRLTSSASQTVGYGTTTATYAIMDTIVYVGRYSVTEIGAGDGYQDVCIYFIKENYLSETYLASDTKSMPTFGTGASLNGASQSFTDTVFVSSREEIMAVAGTYQIKFSDFVMDFMTSFKGTVPLYYTRDLGTNLNHVYCLTPDGALLQYQPNRNKLGVQFTIKVSEYACVER